VFPVSADTSGWDDAPSEEGEPELDNQPPQDLHAEQAVLGSVLVSFRALDDVAGVLTPEDFYRPGHSQIWAAVTALWAGGEPADPVTVSEELDRRGELLRVGGGPYLHTLMQATPTAANVTYYAEIVAAKAVLRRVREAGLRITQLAEHGSKGASLDEVLDFARREFTDATTSRDQSQTLVHAEPAVWSFIESLDRPPVGVVKTSWPALDEQLSGGLRIGELIVVAANTSVGKALALDTPLATPTGWTTMGTVQVGDQVFGADGKPTTVTNATPVMTGRPCYEVEFSDGSVLVADADHQWLTETRSSRCTHVDNTLARTSPYSIDQRWKQIHPSVVTTEQIMATLRFGTYVNHSVKLAAPLELPESEDLPIDPYVLGCWLGDGDSLHGTMCGADPEVFDNISFCGYEVGPPIGKAVRTCPHRTVYGLITDLRRAGLVMNKHIPVAYLRASVGQRRELLAGLLDTDGYVCKLGKVQFAVTSKVLAEGTLELILSLGYRATMRTKRVKGRTEKSSTCYMINFTPGDKVFKLTRKVERQRAPQRSSRRMIRAVRPVASVPVRCIEVDNSDHLYLAGPTMIPTHNSLFGGSIARAAAQDGVRTVMFTLEMTTDEVMARWVADVGTVPLSDLMEHQLGPEDQYRAKKAAERIQEWPLWVDDTPGLSVAQIRARCQQLGHPGLVVVDQLSLMSPADPKVSRQEQLSRLSWELKELAKQLGCPIVVLHQLNSEPTKRIGGRPTKEDLRESRAVGHNASKILLLWRRDDEPQDITVIVDKHRNGPTGDVRLSFVGKYARIGIGQPW
jgi:replicative DNA helicase